MADSESRPWYAEHVDRYLATDGEDGHDWQGVPTLLLTTRGRKSGEPRTLPLIYGRDGDRLLIVASRGGAPSHPSWFLNLQADPHVQVQVKADRFDATARAATPDEKPRLWKTMTSIWPAYDEYQTRTDRDIPVVVLERAGA
ncbi:MAG TPA: nitroreductase family deazaflavin-dependent oxidoreductase [Gaiellales bacterium]|jgi:deazaflavin-dependent oxidoreductase (nitroreductase family)